MIAYEAHLRSRGLHLPTALVELDRHTGQLLAIVSERLGAAAHLRGLESPTHAPRETADRLEVIVARLGVVDAALAETFAAYRAEQDRQREALALAVDSHLPSPGTWRHAATEEPYCDEDFQARQAAIMLTRHLASALERITRPLVERARVSQAPKVARDTT